MLSFFRINDPYRLLGVLILWVLICLPRLINTPDLTIVELKLFLLGEKFRDANTLYGTLLDSNAPLMAAFSGFLNWIMGRSQTGYHILSLLFIFIQAAYFGITLIYKKAFPENNFLPAFFFAVLAAFSFDMLALSGDLLASGVLLIALNSLFREIEFREQSDSAFAVGFFISIASLFSFSYSIFLFAAITIFIIFTRSSSRKYLLLIVGFLLPHLLMMSIYYLNNNLDGLWQNFYLPNLVWSNTWLISGTSLIVLGAIPLFYFIVSFIWLNREAHFTKYQLQLVQAMFFWMIFAFIQILYSKNIRPQSFISFIPVAAFYLTHFILLIRRKKFAEINGWIILIGVLVVSYMSQAGKINRVDYSSLSIPANPKITFQNKRVLNLADDFSIYQHNKLGSGFVDWQLAKPIFAEPQYYENLLLVNQSLMEDLPEVIIDPHQYMKNILQHLPALRLRYKKVDNSTYELIKTPSTTSN